MKKILRKRYSYLKYIERWILLWLLISPSDTHKHTPIHTNIFLLLWIIFSPINPGFYGFFFKFNFQRANFFHTYVYESFFLHKLINYYVLVSQRKTTMSFILLKNIKGKKINDNV